MQMPAIQAAKAAGHRITVIDPNPHAPGSKVADEAHAADLADQERCLMIARSCRPDGVMTFAADYPMPMVGKITDALGLPGPDPHSIEAATDKKLMRETLAAAGVPVPAWRVVYCVGEIFEAIADLGTDVVVKPPRSSGGRGVTKLERGADDEHVRWAHEHARVISPDESSPLVVEQFVGGAEFSVEAITADGATQIVTCTDKETTGPPHFVEIGHRQPTALDDSDQARLEEVAHRSIAALGLRDTASHTEIRFGPSGPVVMEIASRCGGGYICSHLVPLSTGIDMVGAAVSVALGLKPNLTATRSRGAAIAFVCPEPGILASIGDIDRARSMPSVVELSISISVGDRVPFLRDARDRIGYCICEGRDGAEAAQRCAAAIEALSVRTNPLTPKERRQ
jgi:biotin carboxylase